MNLLSKSFLVRKGEDLSAATQFLLDEIGLDAYLLKEIQAENLNPEVTCVTLLYHKYAEEIIDNILPRKGGIYTRGIVGNGYSQIVFSQPIGIGSLVSGAVLIDGTALAANRLSLVPESNDYILKINLTGYNNNDFHEIRLDRELLKRKDNSLFEYSPVLGYVLHTYPAPHLGDYTPPYRTRARGRVKIDVIRVDKAANISRLLVERLAYLGTDPSSLLYYTSAKTDEDLISVFFAYVSSPEPIILDSFPLNNSLLPQGSPPNNVTFVFNTELDKSYVQSNSFITVTSSYATVTDIPYTAVSLLSDNRTLVVDTTSYITNSGAYSLVINPGLRTNLGVVKVKPEQWNCYVDAYLTISGGSIGTQPVLEDFIQYGDTAGENGALTLSGKYGINLDPSITGFLIISNTGEGLAVDYRPVTGDIVPSVSGQNRLGTEPYPFESVQAESGIYKKVYTTEMIVRTGVVPSDPANYGYDIFVYNSGATPSRETYLYALNSFGQKIIISSSLS